MENTVTTEAGLVVPESAVAVDRQDRTMAPRTLKRIQRFMREMDAEDIGFLIVCKRCNQSLRLYMTDRIEADKAGGKPMLRCKCSDRVERR